MGDNTRSRIKHKEPHKMSQGEEDERYYQVAAVFKQFGQPNAQFPKDLDLEYTELQKHVAAMGGLGTVLKNMKAKNMVFYADPFIKAGTQITLINDYWQEVNPQMITYDRIKNEVQGDDAAHSSHTKVAGW